MTFCGIRIGHETDSENHTGCTVFLCPEGTVGGVDVRGPAPGSRETALLASDKAVSSVHAVVFSGGSAFGLAVADGVMRFLGEKGIGHPTPVHPIPIVPAAIVYDLFFSGGRQFPDAEMGYAACMNASSDNEQQGNVGAGTGVTVGKWSGISRAMKGGFGLAGYEKNGLSVCAAAVVNSVGDVLNADGSILAGARKSDGAWMADDDPLRIYPERPPANVGTNTTLVLLATNARLDKVGVNRLAQRAHDGLAIAVHPAHTTHDGDTAFALATGTHDGASFDQIGNLGVFAVAEAIRNAVRHAASVNDIIGLAS